MHDYRAIFNLEVKPIILRPETMEHMPIAINISKVIVTQTVEFLFRNPEFLKQLKLL